MSELKQLVENYTSRNERSMSWVARKMDVSPQTLSSWWHRGTKRLPTPENLRSLAAVLGVPYRYVLEAALTDAGYLPESLVKVTEHESVRLTATDAAEADR